jgi:hypothetical protein
MILELSWKGAGMLFTPIFRIFAGTALELNALALEAELLWKPEAEVLLWLKWWTVPLLTFPLDPTPTLRLETPEPLLLK